MPEGTEHLLYRPFKEIALPQDQALKTLAARSKDVLDTNIESCKQLIRPDQPDLEFLKLEFEQEAKGILDKNPGGLSMTSDELERIYQRHGNHSYAQILSLFTDHVF